MAVMKIIVPDYYFDFKCIADKCKNTCCSGWEIDVDDDTFEDYKNLKDDFGQKILDNIEITQSGKQFRLIDDRCPFLNKDNLCDIILGKGEDYLCQICRDHPRFRNFWTNQTEIGIGIVCEEAARIILTKKEKTRFIVMDDDGITEEASQYENNLLEIRNQLLSILQDRSIDIDSRVLELLNSFDIVSDDLILVQGNINQVAFEQFAVYLLYRNFSDALYDGRVTDRIKFIVKSFFYVRNQWLRDGKNDIESLIEYARVFSMDKEYDTETWNF